MNRQTKRAMAKQEEKRRAGGAAQTAAARAAGQKKERTKPRQFFREVVAELRKVAWPSRQEVIAYTIVVLVAVIVIASLIFGMDFVFTKAILALFGVDA